MNVRNSKILLKSLVAGCALALAAGCATTSQLEEVRAEAAEAKRMAEQAQSQVANARSMIEEAMAAAREAKAEGETELQHIRRELEQIRLVADEVLPAEADKTAKENAARGAAAFVEENGKAKIA